MVDRAIHRSGPELLNPPNDRLARYAHLEDPEASLSKFFEIIGAHRELFLMILLSVLAVGAAYIFGSPKKYASTMELLVTNNRSMPTISPGKTETPGAAQEVTEEQLNSEAEIVKSTDVLNPVVDPNWNNTQMPRSNEALVRHESALGILRKELQVTPIRRTYLLSVQLTTTNPYEARQLLLRLLTSFLAEKRRLIQPAGLWQMFSQQAEQYRQQWLEAQQQLSLFQQNNGMVSVSEQEDSLQKQLLSVTTDLQTSEAELAFTRDRIHGDISQIQSTPQRLVTRKTDIPDTGSVDQLHKQLNELEQRRTELLTEYRSGDRLILQVDSEINQTKSALEKTLNYHAYETSSDVNPTWQAVEQDFSENSAKIAALDGRCRTLQQEIGDLHNKLKSVEKSAGTYDALQNKVTELDQDYQLYLQKRDEAQMAEVMNEHQVLNVAVAQEPTFSEVPVSPKPLRDGVLTVGTGLLLASFVVFVFHNSQPGPLEGHLDLEDVAHYPILVDVPETIQDSIARPNSPARSNVGV